MKDFIIIELERLSEADKELAAELKRWCQKNPTNSGIKSAKEEIDTLNIRVHDFKTAIHWLNSIEISNAQKRITKMTKALELISIRLKGLQDSVTEDIYKIAINALKP